MSKELWCDDFNEKYNECIEEGMTDKEAIKEATVWADGYMERLQDNADNLRKAEKENNL